MRTTRTTIAVLAAATALVMTACGSDEPTSTPEPAGENGANSADVTFATEMIQHHAQALVMVDMTQGRDLDPEVRELTETIREAQAPEIETMTGWLLEWGEDVPETSRDHANSHGGHDTGEEEMPGMMTAEQMDSLEQADGPEFQTMWLEMMVEHHEGAVEMAETEVAQGAHPGAVDLAEQVIQAQRAEITTMEQLLAD